MRLSGSCRLFLVLVFLAGAAAFAACSSSSPSDCPEGGAPAWRLGTRRFRGRLIGRRVGGRHRPQRRWHSPIQ